MITVQEALQQIQKHCTSATITTVKLKEAVNYYLAETVISEINMPPFNQSAMDGYALHLHSKIDYTIIDEVKAGDKHDPVIKKGEAVRIFTGAPVPKTANAVVMQEKTIVTNNKLTLTATIIENTCIRPLGEQIKKGETALQKGTKLTPAAIGYLASLGITNVMVYKKPSIAIVATGNELVAPGKKLNYGEIYESNSVMLKTALQNIHYTNSTTYKVIDDYQSTYTLLKKVIKNHDVVLISGGISVGDYDFVGKALLEIGVTQIFYKVKQKPGKPLFFGKKGGTSVFALPGNPAAALSCFYVYVQTALQKIIGNTTQSNCLSETAIATTSFQKKGDRAQFLKAILQNGKVEILEGQSSAMQQTFALANALVYLPEEIKNIEIGDSVALIKLPI